MSPVIESIEVGQEGVFPGAMASHSGSDGTYAWMDPKRKVVGLLFTQSPGGKIPRTQFRKMVNAACDK